MEPVPNGVSYLPESVRKELAALAETPDEDIDYPDIPAAKDEDWADAVRGKFYRPDTHFKHKKIDHGPSEPPECDPARRYA